MTDFIRTYPCMDCGAEFVNNERTHEPTCPLAVALDEAMDADRAWFDAHPHATEYYRDLTIAERDTVIRTLPGDAEILEISGKIRVVLIGPGLRARDFSNVRWVYAA